MKKKSLLLACFIVFGCVMTSNAQSYEGYISESLPVWVDLIIPANDSTVTGTYFYKKDGGIIPLSGPVNGKQITLNETNKDGVCTGIFSCVNFGDSITGKWSKPNSAKSSSVKLYKTDVSLKLFATIPAAAKLILSDGKTLNNELTEYAGEGSKKPKLVYLFAEKNILSISFAWETMGAYLSSGTIYHTFDLTNNKEISLLNEINPDKLSALKSKIKTVIQKELDEHRKQYTQQDWIDAFGDKETFEKSFTVSETGDNILVNWYLKRGVLTVVIDNYFGFPHVIQAMDFSGEWKSSFTELRLYLKENSILKNIQ